MKTKFLQMLIAFCCFSFYAFAQDVLKYYIVYDASGSVHTIDKKDNLQNSLLQLLEASREKERKYDQAISFLLVPFGEEKNVEKAITYGNSRDTEKLFQKMIIDNTQKSRRQRHSDIKAALKMVLDSLNHNNTNTPSGVFVFTDGYFIEKDIADPSSSSSYKNSVDSLILAIEKKVGAGKIFYIQTSPYNPQFRFSNLNLKPKEALNNVLKDSCLYSKNYFWIAAGVSVDSPGYKQHLEQFIYNANIAIITPNELPLDNEREVAITLQEIFTLYSRLKTDNRIKNIFPTTDSLIREIDNLINLPTLSRDEMETIQLTLVKLTHNNNVDSAKIQIQKNKTQSPAAHSILELLYKIKDSELTFYRDTLIQFIQNNPINHKKQETLSSIALTESYKPVTNTILTNEVKQNKGWENLEQNLINGTADYLVKRAKQEVVYSFIENLHTYFDNDSIRKSYMLIFFPTVWQASKDRYAIPDLLQIRDAFKKDVKNIPKAIYSNDKLVKNPSMLTLWVFMRFYDELLNTGNLEYTFRIIAQEITQNDSVPLYDTSYLKQSIKLSLNLLSYLNDNDIAAVYASHNRDSIIKLSKLLYILSIDNSSLSDTSIIVYNLEKVSKTVSKIYSDYEIAKKQIQTLKTLLDKPPVSDFEGYHKYHRDLLLDILHRSATLITSGAEIIASQKVRNTLDSLTNSVTSRNTINAAQNGIEAWFDIQNGNYKQAILNLFSTGFAFTDQNKDLYNILMISGEIASTNSAEEVSNVLLKYLLPVASYKTKRNNHWSIMVNAYLGIGGNYYRNSKKSITWAIHAPIGIEFSRNFQICDWRSNISIMPTLFDIGNVTNYRYIQNSDSIPASEVVSLERIFSPGVILSVGVFNKIPVAFIAGYQYNPNRYMAGIAVDMPLVGIWKRNYPQKK